MMYYLNNKKIIGSFIIDLEEVRGSFCGGLVYLVVIKGQNSFWVLILRFLL